MGPYRLPPEPADEELLRLFADQMRLTIQALRGDVAAGSPDGIRRQAHSLQGMGGTAGFPEISVAGEELSLCAKRGDLARCGALTDRLERWQEGSATRPPEAGPGPARSGMPRLSGSILIVDDELPNRQFLRKLLTENGADVIEAANGEEALEKARQAGLDLALVDVMMPGLSGYEVCKRLTDDPATSHVAVIMVTALSAADDVEHAFVQGAFDYIRKPFNARELLARVRHALQINRQNDALRQWQIRMVREMDAAGALQRKLLNTDPYFRREIEIHSAFQSSMTVGGDVFDTLALPDNRLCVFVGDVSGHGVGPAMISTLFKALVGDVAREHADSSPAALCNEIHRRFRNYVTNPEIYTTLFLALIDPGSRRCVAYSCGHPMPLLFDASGAALFPFADRGGLPIGLPSGRADSYKAEDEVQAVLPPGSSLFIFTDGLLEARRADAAESRSDEQLEAVLAAVARDTETAHPSRDILDRMAALGYQLAQDDCTLMTIRPLDPAAFRLERDTPPRLEAVAALAAEVEQVLLAAGWPGESAHAARLLTMEHGVNMVDHAQAPAGTTLGLRLRLTPGRAWLLFRDRGREWDFQDRLAFSLRQPDDSERGRGLRIIEAIAEHIDVVRRDGENTILYAISRTFDHDGRTGRERGERP